VSLGPHATEIWGGHLCKAYQHTIRLITGRTHQIRAQFAAMGSPLLGDILYETLHENGLQVEVPSFPSFLPSDQDGPNAHDAGTSQGSDRGFQHESLVEGNARSDIQLGKKPVAGHVEQWIQEYRERVREERPIGLQASELVIDRSNCMGNPPRRFTAGRPWWLESDT
jgi:hypothetical protein